MDARSETDIITRQAGIEPGSRAEAALKRRADVMAMTEATHEAALRPLDPGGLSHGERAALAVRIARRNAEASLAAHYLALLDRTDADDTVRALADTDFDGEGDVRQAAILAFTDRVTMQPRRTEAADIDALKAAGIGDADIVRLAELNAFLAYQIRLVAGLRLMGDGS